MCGYASPSMSAKDKKSAEQREREYRAEDDHRTMTRAAEIEGDKDRMSGVREHHRKQSAALGRVAKRFGTRSSSGRSGSRA